MNYVVFDALNAGTLCRAEDETEQAFMERVYRMLCEEEGAACGLIGLMKPSFLSCSAENRSLTLDFAAEDWMLNSKQTLHGGMLASMLDNTMGLAARFVCKTNRLSTVSLAVNYLRPVLSGERVTVAAQVDQAGRRMIFLSGCVYAENGNRRFYGAVRLSPDGFSLSGSGNHVNMRGLFSTESGSMRFSSHQRKNAVFKNGFRFCMAL